MFVVSKTRAWAVATNGQSREARRQADVYVFSFLASIGKTTIDPLNVNQRKFYVLPTPPLDARTRSQHSMTLKSLERLCGGAVHYTELRKVIAKAASKDLA